jgi:hypothetical protein
MPLFPPLQTDKAKLVAAKTCHVVASLSLFDEHAAGRTPLPLLEVKLKVYIARTIVLQQHALLTKFRLAGQTGKRLAHIYNALAVLNRTKTQTRVADSLLPKEKTSILLSILFWQVLKAGAVDIDGGIAIILWTGDFLHHTDLVDEIVVQAPFAELMLTLTHTPHFILFKPYFAELTHPSHESAVNYYAVQVKLHILLG